MCSCGCPTPQTDHAARMAAFALQLAPAMAVALCRVGAPQLQLRVGMHSGSVTAGVLRIDRGRFQSAYDAQEMRSKALLRCMRAVRSRLRFVALFPAVFGDTVNMASRMESTGAPGRVQLSEATALLLAGVPGVRLQPRGGVDVKGKGEVQTFWLLDAHGAEKETEA